MIRAFDALEGVIRKRQSDSSRGPGWRARQLQRDKQRDRNRGETERLQAASAERKTRAVERPNWMGPSAGELDTYHFNTKNIIPLGLHHPMFGHIPHGQGSEGVRERMRGVRGLMDNIDPKRHNQALKKLKAILSGDMMHVKDGEVKDETTRPLTMGEEHHLHRDAMPYTHADEKPHPSNTEDSTRIREHGILGHVPTSVSNEASGWLTSLGIHNQRVRDKMYMNIDGNSFVIPMLTNGKVPHGIKDGRAHGDALHDANPFNPDNKLRASPSDDELWARKVAYWREQEKTNRIGMAHRPGSRRPWSGLVPQQAHGPTWQGDEPPDKAAIDAMLALTPDGRPQEDLLPMALQGGWSLPQHPNDPRSQMLNPTETEHSAIPPVSAPGVEQPTEAQRRAMRQPPARNPRAGTVTGMSERMYGGGGDDITASVDIPPMQHAMSILKDGELSPVQQPAGQQPQGGAGGQSSPAPRKTPGEAQEELKNREMDHNATVNNPATEEWVEQILPESQQFHQKMVDWYHSAGLAMHDPEYKKNAKPAEKAMMALSNMIATYRMRHSDTPGFGREKKENGSSPLDAQDTKYLGLGN